MGGREVVVGRIGAGPWAVTNHLPVLSERRQGDAAAVGQTDGAVRLGHDLP